MCMDLSKLPLFRDIHEIRGTQKTILQEIQLIRKDMATTSTATTVGIADVQTAVTQIVNDNTASNNAIAGQLKEIQQIVQDYGVASAGGVAPTQAQFQGVIAQLQAVHSLVVSNTAAITASGTSIVTADPAAAPAPVVTPPAA
jgi:hypothetical protein